MSSFDILPFVGEHISRLPRVSEMNLSNLTILLILATLLLMGIDVIIILKTKARQM